MYNTEIVNNYKKIFTQDCLPSSQFIIFNKSIMAKHPDIELYTASVFKSLIQMIKTLNTEEACREHLEKLLWNGEPICPHCGSQRLNHYKLKADGIFKGLYKCKDCRRRFTVTVGTMFEGSPVPLTKWFLAIYLFTSHKKGISSVQLGKDIDVTQKTAWYMLSRIRNTFQNDTDFQFEELAQVDETFIGGKNKNRNKKKKVENTQGRSVKTKTPVFGMLSEGLVYTQVIPDTKGKTLKTIIKAKIKAGGLIVSDGWMGYRGLSADYQHEIIFHNKGIFKNGPYHTNGIEGFWSHLKRGIIGIYHSISPKHLHKYCDEFAYRYNTRQMTDGERFNLSLINADRRLSYRELTAN
jgi:transposase-like protein